MRFGKKDRRLEMEKKLEEDAVKVLVGGCDGSWI